MPKLKINIPEQKVKISLKLNKSAVDGLNDYSSYMSDIHKIKISPETVMESMIDKLLKDKEFQQFCTSKLDRKGASVSKKTRKNNGEKATEESV